MMNISHIRHTVLAFFLPCAIFAFIAGSASYGFAQSTKAEHQNVTITDPKEGASVGFSIVVRGTCKVSDKMKLWVFVRRVDFVGYWWPQGEALVRADDSWIAGAYLGGPEDIGWDFEIAVAAFATDDLKLLREYQATATQTGYWRPITLPNAQSNIAVIRVHKESESKGSSEWRELPSVKGQIKRPVSGSEVSRHFTVIGTVAGKHRHLWLVEKVGNLHWPKEPELKPKGGEWKGEVFEGGYPPEGVVELLLVDVSEEMSRKFKGWLQTGHQTCSYPGLAVKDLGDATIIDRKTYILRAN